MRIIYRKNCQLEKIVIESVQKFYECNLLIVDFFVFGNHMGQSGWVHTRLML